MAADPPTTTPEICRIDAETAKLAAEKREILEWMLDHTWLVQRPEGLAVNWESAPKRMRLG